MLTIDGSKGEGGGQILRTSLALSLVTGTPVTISNIRKGRAKPGLMRQHLTALRAAAEIGCAKVTGAELGSVEVTFAPTTIAPGEHTFRTGSAGSATLVLQTVLPALLRAKGSSRLTLEGGTDNPMAPPVDFLRYAYLPLLEKMGAVVSLELEARGFYPAGGGRMRVGIHPAPALSRLDLLTRGAVLDERVRAIVANLPGTIATRELEAARAVLGWDKACFRPEVIKDAPGPGNVVSIVIACEHVTEVFTGFGQKGVRAEHVAEHAAREAKEYLQAGAAVGEHLADQLLLPMALAGKGSFRTVSPSSHTTTHKELLEKILGVTIRVEPVDDAQWHVEVG